MIGAGAVGGFVGGVLKIVTQLDPDGAIRQLMPAASIEVGELDATITPRVAAMPTPSPSPNSPFRCPTTSWPRCGC
jgi:hypothetical protein